MSAHIDSPRAATTVTSLSVRVTVTYDTGRAFIPKGAKDKSKTDEFVWDLKCKVSSAPEQSHLLVPAGQHTDYFDFSVPQADDYEVTTHLFRRVLGSSDPPTPAGDDSQSPVHVTVGGGIIFPSPLTAEGEAQAQAQGGEAQKAEAAGGEGQVADTAACQPVVIKALFPTASDDPTTGIVVEVYHVQDVIKDGVSFSRDVTDFLAIAQMHGGGLVGLPGGVATVYTSFSVVFPREARQPGRQLKYHRIGILGRVVTYSGGAVT